MSGPSFAARWPWRERTAAELAADALACAARGEGWRRGDELRVRVAWRTRGPTLDEAWRAPVPVAGRAEREDATVTLHATADGWRVGAIERGTP